MVWTHDQGILRSGGGNLVNRKQDKEKGIPKKSWTTDGVGTEEAMCMRRLEEDFRDQSVWRFGHISRWPAYLYRYEPRILTYNGVIV